MSIDIAGDGAGRLAQVGALLADRYRLEELIGRGGMATVYRATDEALGRTVAIKVFRDDLADGDDVRRQRDEIRLIARLDHFALVTLFDAVADDGAGEHGQAFIVMQYVAGRDLRDRLGRGPLPPRTAALVGADVAEALAYVHARGVVHRDVKPGNILLPEAEGEATGPRAMLADFGIARIVDGTRITATGSVLGTANYLSPEQAAGTALSGASDVYSLGLVLIECLTGEKSFPGSALESVAARLSSDPPSPTGFGPEWESLLRSMTAREPAERVDALTAAARLREIAVGPEVLEPTLRYPSPVAQPRTRRNRMALAGVAIAGILIAIAAAIGVWIVTSRAPSPHAAQTSITYPAVPGELGNHLKQLEKAVTP
jgi:serine/threonine protein kinase